MSPRIHLLKTSLLDYPGRISSVLFFPGCNLRCPWCHNRDLVLGSETDNALTADETLAFLRKRGSVLGGVVLSGGEPCLWDELPDLICEIKKTKSSDRNGELPVKLDTNGMFPFMLEKLFSREETCPDYIALDLKIAPSRYRELLPLSSADCGSLDPGEALVQSAALIANAGIAHEYRTLVLPGACIGENDIEALAPLVDSSPWYFRPFRAGNCLESAWDSREEPAGVASSRMDILAKKACEMGKNAKTK